MIREVKTAPFLRLEFPKPRDPHNQIASTTGMTAQMDTIDITMQRGPNSTMNETVRFQMNPPVMGFTLTEADWCHINSWVMDKFKNA